MSYLFWKNWRITLSGYGLVAFFIFSFLWLILNLQVKETSIVCIQASCSTTIAPWYIELGMTFMLSGALLSALAALTGFIFLTAQFIAKKFGF
jgi:hypothetical protein